MPQLQDMIDLLRVDASTAVTLVASLVAAGYALRKKRNTDRVEIMRLLHSLEIALLDLNIQRPAAPKIAALRSTALALRAIDKNSVEAPSLIAFCDLIESGGQARENQLIEIADANPSLHLPACLLCLYYKSRKKYDLAQEWGARAAENYPTICPCNYFNLAMALNRVGREREAGVLADRLTEAYPTVADGWALRGIVFHGQKAYDQACENHKRAVRLSPENAGFHKAYAYSLVMLNQREAAIGHYKKSLELDPNDNEARIPLAQAIEREDPLMAEKLLMEALMWDPADAKAAEELALTRQYIASLPDNTSKS